MLLLVLVLFHSKYQLVFCYTLIERNNRQMLPVIRNTAGGDSVQTCTNPLDTFFPFDPCVLKRWVLHSRPFGGEFKCGVYMPFPGSALRVSLSCVALLVSLCVFQAQCGKASLRLLRVYLSRSPDDTKGFFCHP